MEAKTMGKFIATLRKANGMTQKELAEKLHVSDKSVSRWETDEGAPDLSLIPVIAEIFGVTCDELLRGERKPQAERTETEEEREISPKGEKQRQRLLKAGLAKYRSKTLISVGITVAGLIAAMLFNLGFHKSYLGFFVAAIFYLAAFVCQVVFLNGAMLALTDEEEDEALLQCKQHMVRLTQGALGLTAVLFAFTLPLVLSGADPNWGLHAGTWLSFGSLLGLAAALLWLCVCYLADGWRMKQQGQMDSREGRMWCLKGQIAILLALVMLGTTVVRELAINRERWALKYGETFEDYETFKNYMETRETTDSYGVVGFTAIEHVEYDAEGNVLAVRPPEGELYYYATEEVRIADGTPEGKLMCTYLWKNQKVSSVHPADNDTGLPITVTTEESWQMAELTANRVEALFVLVYAAEVAAAVLVYQKKKSKRKY